MSLPAGPVVSQETGPGLLDQDGGDGEGRGQLRAQRQGSAGGVHADAGVRGRLQRQDRLGRQNHSEDHQGAER